MQVPPPQQLQNMHRSVHVPAPKIYNAVYSSVQVYECMVRGIAVMRRRTDSYVNATQILKVAGVDKGRRTKILEKEILPGKHEIVQGGYGKYQGTWIPLERGRDVALQYGVAPLLAPLFDFVPNPGHQAPILPPLAARSSPRPGGPPTPGASFTSAAPTGAPYVSSSLAPPPIMPGSALRLLNQGRAQGLFTPSTSGIAAASRPPSAGYYSAVYPPGPYPYSPGMATSAATLNSPGQPSLKRARTESDIELPSMTTAPLGPAVDTHMADFNAHDGPSPTKRARSGFSPPVNYLQRSLSQPGFSTDPPAELASHSRDRTATPLVPIDVSRPGSAIGDSTVTNGAVDKLKELTAPSEDDLLIRNSSNPSIPRHMDRAAPAKDVKRAAVVAAICGEDNPELVLKLLSEIPADDPELSSSNLTDIDLVLDEQGHTALHLAASMAQQRIVTALLSHGADPHRGNYNGETALMRACLATPNADKSCFDVLVPLLHATVRTLDSARKSVLHHIVALGGVKGRAQHARFYLEGIFQFIAEKQGGEFRTLVDLQDEHGDTALNIAARVGNRSLVRTLLDVGANRVLPNKLGLRPSDFGVETEALGVGSRADDLLSSLRTAPAAPAQKSQDVIADMTSMINGLSQDFQSEIKTKQDALDLIQTQLRAATRQLADQRKQIQTWQSHCGELEQVTQKARNLEKSLVEEEKFQWDRVSRDFEISTGLRTELSPPIPPPPYTAEDPHPQGNMHASDGTRMAVDGVGVGGTGGDFSVPVEDTVESLVRLRRMKHWYQRTEKILQNRLRNLHGASAEKEFQCKKIVALCAGIPIDKVDDMLENLVIALESETQAIEVVRVSGFMQKVRDGVF